MLYRRKPHLRYGIGIGCWRRSQIRDRLGLRLALIGVAAGATGAVALTRLIRGLRFGIISFDPTTFVAMAFMLVAVTLRACVIPAKKRTPGMARYRSLSEANSPWR